MNGEEEIGFVPVCNFSPFVKANVDIRLAGHNDYRPFFNQFLGDRHAKSERQILFLHAVIRRKSAALTPSMPWIDNDYLPDQRTCADIRFLYIDYDPVANNRYFNSKRTPGMQTDDRVRTILARSYINN